MKSRPEKHSHRLMATAYHEAGHAMAAWRVGARFKYVTIDPGKDSLGHILYAAAGKHIRPDIAMTPATRYWLERRILCIYAGPEAERKFTGRYNHVGASKDYSDAVDLSDRIIQDFEGGEELAAFMKWMRIQAKKMVASNICWKATTLLAGELLKRRTIRFKDAIEIMNEAWGTIPTFAIKTK